MVQTAYALALATVAGLVSASPIARSVSCGDVIMPSTQVQLKQADPDTSYPNTAHGDQSVSLSQGANGAGKPPFHSPTSSRQQRS